MFKPATLNQAVYAVFVLLFSICAASAQEKINVESLLSEAALDKNKNAIADYTYRMEFVRRVRNGGKIKNKSSQLFEIILPSQIPSYRVLQHPLMLIAKNGKSLPSDILREKRMQLSRALELLENESEKFELKIPAKDFDGGYFSFNIRKDLVGAEGAQIKILPILENSHFDNAQIVERNSRKTVLLEFKLKDENNLPRNLAYLSKLEGLIWIDQEDKRVTRLEAFPAGLLTQLKSKTDEERSWESTLLYVQTRVGDGYWFPQCVRLNFLKNPKLLNGTATELEYNFKEYKRFRVEMNNLTVTLPK